jgi:hypothetical protein
MALALLWGLYVRITLMQEVLESGFWRALVWLFIPPFVFILVCVLLQKLF